MTHPNQAEALLDRYLNHTCTAAERALVEQWYDMLLLPGAETAATGAAEESRQRFRAVQPLPQAARLSWLTRLKWVAAAALVTLMASTLLYLGNRSVGDAATGAPRIYTAVTGPAAIKQVLLPDSTVVTLNANSSLEWDADFSRQHREVQLLGEAGFDVYHDSLHPFIVHTGQAKIRVLGTCFNVRTDPAGSETEVALLRGKVAVSLPVPEQPELLLLPGEVATTSVRAKRLVKKKADVSLYFAWMSGEFYAADQPLEEVVERLCRHYGYTVRWQHREGIRHHITVTFRRQQFTQMLSSLCFVNHLRYHIDGNTITIR